MTDQAITTKDEATDKLTKSDVYHPTPHMIVWLDTAIRLMTDSVTDVSEECKISRTAWYDWLKDDDFRLWFKQEWDKRLSGEAWKLDVIGFKQSKRDFNYWKGMQQRVGNLKENSTTITGDKVIAILGGVTKDEV